MLKKTVAKPLEITLEESVLSQFRYVSIVTINIEPISSIMWKKIDLRTEKKALECDFWKYLGIGKGKHLHYSFL